ncbi:MAG: universal stress protein [Pirellulales bacterium]
MRILIGVDGSEQGYQALAQAVSLMSPEKDELALCYSPPGGTSTALVDAVWEKAMPLVPPPARARVQTLLGTRPPHEELLAVADEWRADLIVVGARGLGPVKRLMLGSVSAKVARGAKIPVLVARDAKARPVSASWNVLVAVESRDTGLKVAPVISALHWPTSSKGRLMAVIDAMFVGEIPDWLAPQVRSAETQAMADAWMREHEAEREAKRQELLELAKLLPPPFQNEPLIAEGHATEEILKAIDREHANLIVVGAADKNIWQRYVLGTTSDAVLVHAHCSVLVVRDDGHWHEGRA